MAPSVDLDAEAAGMAEALRARLGLEDLSFDTDDALTFVLDGKLVFQLQIARDTDEVVIVVVFGVVTDTLPGSLMRRMMEANHFWGRTNGGTLGLDPQSGALTLCYKVALPLDDAATIGDVVLKLAAAADHWRRQVVDAVEAGVGPSSGMIRA